MSVIPNLEAMLSDGQDNSLIRFGLANAYVQDNRLELAITHYEEALQQDARYTAAWRMYAKTLELLMQYEAARSAYLKGINVAEEKGDFQTAKEMRLALRLLRELENQ